jgi:murein DD-endopeptidase MepM/ murein hydrolase activator NlpD
MVKHPFWSLSLSVVLVVFGCARQKIAIDRPPLEGKGVYHVVERHQTLYRICKTYGVDINKVASLNGLADPGKIQVGQRIFIPGAKRVLKVGIYLDDIARESFHKERKKPSGMLNFMWPVEGSCVESFEESGRRKHLGIDISSPLGTLIKASGPGLVLYSGNGIRGYGNVIILRHSEEFVSVYAHNDINLVEEGRWVEKGEVIGKVGRTGRASGPHLHFEIRKNNKAIDPLLFLN